MERTARMSFTADERAMWGPPVAIAAEISSLYCLPCPDMQQASQGSSSNNKAHSALAASAFT